jgi:hypothetical protein
MDWTKIKTKHFLFTDWTDRMTAGFVKLLCLTAHLERMPNNKEMLQVCGRKSLESLSQVLHKSDTSLSQVLEKVLEDVDRVDKKKQRDRDYHSTYDKSRQRAVVSNSLPREEKIREDKRRVCIKRFAKPTLTQLETILPKNEASKFNDFYESKGWKVGNASMKSWEAAARNWKRNMKETIPNYNETPTRQKPNYVQPNESLRHSAPPDESFKALVTELSKKKAVK